jgi:hypothetical protein
MSNPVSKIALLFLFLTLICSPIVYGQTVLSADGNTDTYTLITNALAPGATPYEVPDACDPGGAPHIRQTFDSQRGHYVFQSFIHLIKVDPTLATEPIDCDPSTHDTDRQRNEMKTYGPSPDYLKANPGDTVTYRWKFKLDSGFQCSKSFTHLHQIKAVNGNDSNPVITFTCEISGSTPQFQLKFVNDAGTLTTWKSLTLATSGMLGEWVEAYEKITFNSAIGSPTGSYAVTLTRVHDGATLLSYTKTGIDLLRSGAAPDAPTFYRPKWGIYRSVATYSYLRDEVVLFDHFCLAKGTDDCPAFVETPDFGLSTTQASATVVAGQSASFPWTITPGNGYTGNVGLAVSGVPELTTPSFAPNVVVGGSGSSTLTLNTSPATPPGTYNIKVTAISLNLVHSSNVTLTVNAPPATPALTVFDFTPKQVDAGSAAAAVTVTLAATELSSGINSALVTFKSPSGTLLSTSLSLLSGTNLNGTWQGSLILPQGSETGVWTVASVELTDNASTKVAYSMADLTALNSPTQFVNIRSQMAVRLTDFDGDHKVDLNWHNDATGETQVWRMNGTTVIGGMLNMAIPDTTWRPLLAADFNGDSKADILWHNSSSGANYLWQTNNSLWFDGYGLEPVNDPNWQIIAAVDFDGDGKADLLWRNSSTGDNYVWFMNGSNLKSTGWMQGVTGTDWQFVTIADFNGDGKPDILWHNVTTGVYYAWLMNGTSIVSGVSPATMTDPNWQLAAIADFNGDGRAELLWRNVTTGANYMWMLDSTGNFASGAGVEGVTDMNWQIVAVGDLDGDKKADLVWRNTSTGANYVWFMDGATLVNSGGIPAMTDPNWKLY